MPKQLTQNEAELLVLCAATIAKTLPEIVPDMHAYPKRQLILHVCDLLADTPMEDMKDRPDPEVHMVLKFLLDKIIMNAALLINVQKDQAKVLFSLTNGEAYHTDVSGFAPKHLPNTSGYISRDTRSSMYPLYPPHPNTCICAHAPTKPDMCGLCNNTGTCTSLFAETQYSHNPSH